VRPNFIDNSCLGSKLECLNKVTILIWNSLSSLTPLYLTSLEKLCIIHCIVLAESVKSVEDIDNDRKLINAAGSVLFAQTGDHTVLFYSLLKPYDHLNL